MTALQIVKLILTIIIATSALKNLLPKKKKK